MPEFLGYLYLFCIGLVFGSFLNVLADRLPQEESIMGRSHCDSCKHVLSPFDLFPLISFLLLKARCRYCHKKLSWQYPLAELVTGVIFVCTWMFTIAPATSPFILSLFGGDFGYTVVYKVVALMIAASLIVLFLADIRYQILPDSMQVTLFGSVFALHVLGGAPPIALFWYVLAGAGVLTPMLLLYLLTRGRGMGFGDVKYAFNMGFMLGIINGLISLYFAFVGGGVVGLILIVLNRKKMKSAIPFGPFLILSVVIMVIWGTPIVTAIKHFFSM